MVDKVNERRTAVSAWPDRTAGPIFDEQYRTVDDNATWFTERDSYYDFAAAKLAQTVKSGL